MEGGYIIKLYLGVVKHGHRQTQVLVVNVAYLGRDHATDPPFTIMYGHYHD